MSVMMGNSQGEVANGGVAGTKRRADESSLSDSERFAKRFNLLNLGAGPNGNSKYYIAKQPTPTTTPTSTSLVNGARTTPAGQTNDEYMDVEDTRDRVYIRDLDEELADIESDEEKLIFLPDIEKRLSKLPRHILTGRAEDQEGQELVLYGVPKSLTVQEGQDTVRKAIIESRQRARDKAIEEARHEEMKRQYDQSALTAPAETAHGYSGGYMVAEDTMEHDPDAMDMD
ncbi:hypothetical protein DOTSEDRAFT_151664 [Dothistroma septosporum NZE10]|uniref:Uncharacterized protein n=1 Tax=Dothistroma septosporum (strain NZE10 / CBS 128990) TaxID=675120 RepID=N1PLY8_DOTSN|nr:hypothetical protein DOTSEDRAFT_151664 [Dothistroma septosporum NZE10]